MFKPQTRIRMMIKKNILNRAQFWVGVAKINIYSTNATIIVKSNRNLFYGQLFHVLEPTGMFGRKPCWQQWQWSISAKLRVSQESFESVLEHGKRQVHTIYLTQ